MSQRPELWVVDPEDPRAPPLEIWERLTEAQRMAIVESLPSEFEPNEALPPEGDLHFNAKVGARTTLGRFFERTHRRVYLACELAVFYPGERMFAPDIIAVRDVEPHERQRWVVAGEGKGIDLALEIFVAGDRRKDHEKNVERYARLGIHEYFIFDRGGLRLSGYRLPAPGATRYERIVPQRGRYVSEVLGLELKVQDEKLRFYHADAEIPEADELIGKLEGMLNGLELRLAEAEETAVRERLLREEETRLREHEMRLREEETRLREEETRRREEETRRREEETRRREEETRLRLEAEQRLADALRELEELKRRR